MTPFDYLHKTLTNMTLEEKIALISSIREDRKVSKKAVSVKKERQERSSVRMITGIDKLTEQDREKLILLLQEDLGNEG